MQHQGLGGVQRTAFPLKGHVEDLGEDTQIQNRAGHHQEDDDRSQQGNGDAKQLLPLIGPVDGCGVIVMKRNPLQTGQIDNYLETQAGPDSGRQNRGQRLADRHEERLLGQPQGNKQVVERPPIGAA